MVFDTTTDPPPRPTTAAPVIEQHRNISVYPKCTLKIPRNIVSQGCEHYHVPGYKQTIGYSSTIPVDYTGQCRVRLHLYWPRDLYVDGVSKSVLLLLSGSIVWNFVNGRQQARAVFTEDSQHLSIKTNITKDRPARKFLQKKSGPRSN